MRITLVCSFALLAIPALASVPQIEPQPAERPKLGACVRQIDGLGEPTGLAFGPDGLLYVAESLAHRVSVIDAEGKSKRTLGADRLVDPRDVALCADGRVVVSDAGLDAIVIFAPDGKVSVIGGRGGKPGEFMAPEGIDVAGDWIAVADGRNDRVQVMKLDGSSVRILGNRGAGEGEFNRPADVAFGPDGMLLVADTFNQRVQCFSKDGKFLRAFGTPGPNPGQFGGPTGLAVHGNFVHVVDRDNSRVQIFSLAGRLDSWYGIHALRPREGQGKLHYPLRLALNADGARAAIAEPMEDRVQILGPVDPNVEELPPLPALPPSHYGGALDADGPLLVVTEPSIPKILIFQMLDGEPIEFGSFGTYGAHSGQVLWPNDVAIDFAKRRIYVADSGSARLLAFEFKFDPKAEIGFDPERVRFVAETKLPIGFDAMGLWRDGDGGLCVVDSRSTSVMRYGADLKLRGLDALPKTLREAVDGCAGPRMTGLEGAHEQYVADRLGGRVYALSSGKAIAEGLVRPSAVLSTASGSLYVSDEGANALLRPGRENPAVARGLGLGPHQLARPRGLAELPGGRVVVIDWGNHRGLIFDAADKFLRAFGSQLFIRSTFPSKAEKAPEPPLQASEAPLFAPLAALDGSKPWHSARHCVSNDGQFAVFWRPTPDPIQERQSFSLEVWVTKLDAPNQLETDLFLALDAGMPEHGHGMNVVPQTIRAADGHFTVQGTRFHMPGRWEMYFDLAREGRTERAQVTLELE